MEALEKYFDVKKEVVEPAKDVEENYEALKEKEGKLKEMNKEHTKWKDRWVIVKDGHIYSHKDKVI